MQTRDEKLYRIIRRNKLSSFRARRHNRKRKCLKKQYYKHPNSRRKLPIPRQFRRRKLSKINNKNSQYRNKKRTEYFQKYLPEILGYILKQDKSPINIGKVRKQKYATDGIVKLPGHFSIIENPKESYQTLQEIVSALFIEDTEWLTLDYSRCSHIDISTQTFLDLLLMDFTKYREKCRKLSGLKDLYPNIRGIGLNDASLRKMIFSVGSPVNLGIARNAYPDIVPYPLTIHKNDPGLDYLQRIEQKELDTSDLADYVITSLKRMKRTLTPEKRDDLCTVIGEILINAEEHSTTRYRFSQGYFVEDISDGRHSGVFRLVILNFGQTIYEKFASPECPNKEIVKRMKNLSKKYTEKFLFIKGKFEEESLWTLYALQEGVTSISTQDYKRGNGSIRFIDSFFNIKGSPFVDDVSVMTITSGHTQILFNGRYNIQTKVNQNNEKYKVMTFNESGEIEDKPDSEFVRHLDYYFPGTMITAKILLNDDDLKTIQ